MAQQTMYPGQVNSPVTELASAIDDTDTTITVVDGDQLPDAPNLAVIGVSEIAETILYTGKTGNDLTGVTRGFQGGARSWSIGTKVARMFTSYDYDAMRGNIADHESRIAGITPAGIGAETPTGAQAKVDAHAAITNTHGATSAATASRIILRDAAGRAKVAAPAASDDIARKAEVDTKLNASAYTAADVLTKLKTVDGSGSGLDADLVRGVTFRENAGVLEYSTNAGGTWVGMGIRSVQRGETNAGNATGNVDVTISAVNTEKAFVLAPHSQVGEGSTFREQIISFILLNSTTLRIKVVGSANSGKTVPWEVVEFN